MTNVGTFERILRIVVGMLIFSLYFVLKGNIRFIGLVGLLPIITGSVGTCPMYAFLGVNTNKVRER